jgi:hypothetical protein
MARKPVEPSRARARAKRPPILPPPRIRMPRACSTPARPANPPAPRAARSEIRLSGAWLESVGFPKGTRYLISVERPFQTIILQALQEKDKERRRR